MNKKKKKKKKQKQNDNIQIKYSRVVMKKVAELSCPDIVPERQKKISKLIVWVQVI